MLYQKLLMGDTPYFLSYTELEHYEGFQEHRHPEAEFIYCLNGDLGVTIEKVYYTVNAGSIVLIPPMASHETAATNCANSKLVIEAGPSLLKRHFDAFLNMRFTSPVIRLDDKHHALSSLLRETALLKQQSNEYSDLIITGNIYKICGIILSEFTEISSDTKKNLKAISDIEKALELIHTRYAEPLTVDLAASLTGYGKSNFCKVFKTIVGDTFHNVLNRKRIENARIYLEKTAMPISEIASATGFADVKSFCRVFKSITGQTAGQMRKSTNSQ